MLCSSRTTVRFTKVWSLTLSVTGTARFVFLALLILQPVASVAHDDPGGRITALTYQIALDPNDPALLLKRGELLRLGGHHEAALRDFEAAARRDGGPGEVDFQRGLTLLEAARPAEAKRHLDRYLTVYPDDSRARATRARALVALGDNLAAAGDFTRVIAVAPLPDYYAARARALVAAGHVDEAVRGLDEGHKRLGTLASLQRLAIDLELARNNIDGAIARVDSMAVITRRADIWLARRGDILSQAGRHNDARAAYGQALAAIETLSPRRQRSKTVRDLKTRLEALLRQRAATESATPLRPAEAAATELQ